MDRLSLICDAENIKLKNNKGVLTKLIQLTEGDLRRSINLLQTCSSFSRDKPEGLTEEDIEQVSGVVPLAAVVMTDEVLRADKTQFSHVQTLAQDLVLEGYDIQALLMQLLEYYLVGDGANYLGDLKKAKVSEVIASTDYSLLTGGNEELNLLNALSSIAAVIR